MMGFNTARNTTTAKYELIIQKYNTDIINKNKQIERALLAVKRQAANKIQNVEQHFIPVEREVIRYVSKKDTATCNINFNEWMQLHNKAASGETNHSSG
ncbi:hypothetical protein [Photobacterium damselae]|uniref:hypothetical protein n=1 Tax=Photobacterium damselae TaxID=38293 RepID=UPI002F3E289B